ncbi:bifunctional hydroxymethylpyrimidine kinase/phosphomethylpyrimidine kinase [Alkalibaculum sp. M08DMB]|uniref:Hydroxymethylpyrimidine/phosphomethylpyrimidine kinase n=1 Tax=Alkalibaculum sporogenes TaxID=2655001 RepID=A0A6A7KAV6_9FIRM|nr:bifunctional hydroxymethylpyrimidine kinase/phosphomethylpyrimidine kinase [Alkalibaculum sporogenes]MPW26679.1 bifunctional hydroxymethylpyrimidine kinase/phosphomethylpyrimidine kinase [Alkalibaculum sporogenes]
MKTALTIAGSDSSGGAGIQADLKTFSAHGVFGMSVITAITAQNTQGVFGVQDIDPSMITKQIEAIFEDIFVDSVKIGMVSKIETIESVYKSLSYYKPKIVVLDPVMVSKSGYHLLQEESVNYLIKYLLPLASIVTPNIPEAEIILGTNICTVKDMESAAINIHKMGAKNVLIKGGHLKGDSIDILYDGDIFTYLHQDRIDTKNTHGTGCTLSSAIASNLARGCSMKDAVKEAKVYITIAIKHSIELGKGVGPTHHFYQLYKNGLTSYPFEY